MQQMRHDQPHAYENLRYNFQMGPNDYFPRFHPVYEQIQDHTAAEHTPIQLAVRFLSPELLKLLLNRVFPDEYPIKTHTLNDPKNDFSAILAEQIELLNARMADANDVKRILAQHQLVNPKDERFAFKLPTA